MTKRKANCVHRFKQASLDRNRKRGVESAVGEENNPPIPRSSTLLPYAADLHHALPTQCVPGTRGLQRLAALISLKQLGPAPAPARPGKVPPPPRYAPHSRGLCAASSRMPARRQSRRSGLKPELRGPVPVPAMAPTETHPTPRHGSNVTSPHPSANHQ